MAGLIFTTSVFYGYNNNICVLGQCGFYFFFSSSNVPAIDITKSVF